MFSNRVIFAFLILLPVFFYKDIFILTTGSDLESESAAKIYNVKKYPFIDRREISYDKKIIKKY